MYFDYIKAATLEDKAYRLLHKHRQQVFNPNEYISDCHYRTIARIKKLMAPLWDRSYIASLYYPE